MTSILPPEIVLIILANVWYPLCYHAKGYSRRDVVRSKQALASCSLISHAWRKMAQSKLFYRIAVVVNRPGLPTLDEVSTARPKTIEEILSFLRDHPALVSQTEVLCLTDQTENTDKKTLSYPIWDAHSLSTFRRLEIELGKILEVLSHFPCLKAFKAHRLEIFPSISSAESPFSVPTTLESLEISGTPLHNFADDFHLVLQPFCAIRELHINRVCVAWQFPSRRQGKKGTSYELFPPCENLTTLSLSCEPLLEMESTLHHLRSDLKASLVSLKHLEFAYISGLQIQPIQELLICLGERLQSLTLGFDCTDLYAREYPDLTLATCSRLETLRFIVRVFTDAPDQDPIGYPREQTKEGQLHISKVLTDTQATSTMPFLKHVVLLYSRHTEWFEKIEVTSCWDEFTPLEQPLLSLPSLEDVAFMPWRERGEMGYGPSDQAEISASLPTLSAQGKLRFPRVDY